jgi:hypothetical protein
MSTAKDRKLHRVPIFPHSDTTPATPAAAAAASSDLEFVDLVSIVACKPNQSEHGVVVFFFNTHSTDSSSSESSQ